MLKQFLLVAGLCALTSALPATAQDGAANQCKASAGAADSGEGIAREAGSRSAVGRRRSGVRVAAGDVNGDGRGDSSGYDAGFRGGVNVAAGDVNGDGAASRVPVKKAIMHVRKAGGDATEAARMKCQNNLKQLGTAAH